MYTLKAKIINKGKIVGYQLISNNKEIISITKDETIKYLLKIDNCYIKSNGYLALKKGLMSNIPEINLNSINLAKVIKVSETEKIVSVASKGEKINLEFDYMNKDQRVAHVVVKEDGTIICEKFTTDVMDNPLPFGNTGSSLAHFFETRCFPKTRANADELLELLGLKHYNPLAIVKKTRGLQYDDFYWIKFKGDTVTFDDIKLRD